MLDRLRGDDPVAQFARFVLVGGTSTVVYAVLFLLLAGLGSQPANIVGQIMSSALANDLHRRSTFHARGRVGWWRAQCRGGVLALGGIVATSATLGWFDTLAPGAGALAQLAVVAVVTGVIGLARFAALRWLLGGRSDS